MTSKSKIQRILFVITFIIGGTFLSFYLTTQPRKSLSVQGSTDSLEAAVVGKDSKAPDFVLKNLDGKNVRLRDLRGNLVMLNFWTTW